MDYGLAKRYTIDVIARLSGVDQNRQLEAYALEHVLGVAGEVRWAREVAERLGFRLIRRTVALQEAERLGCSCDPGAGLDPPGRARTRPAQSRTRQRAAGRRGELVRVPPRC